MGANNIRSGRNSEISNAETDKDLIVIGRQSSVETSKVKGNLVIVGEDAVVESSSVDENVLAFGQTATISSTTAKAVAAMGNAVSVSGTFDNLAIHANLAYIDATVTGNVAIAADVVEFGPNARINGTLYMTGTNEPAMQEGAIVSNIEVVNSIDDYLMTIIRPTVEEFISTLLIDLAVLNFFGALIIALLAEWLFRRQTLGAANLIRKRKGATIGSGVVGAIAIPIVVILLIFLGMTLHVAEGVAFGALSLSAVATGFMGASLFKLAFKNMGRFKCALAGGAILGAASAIPILGIIVHVVAFVYLLGYVLQSIYLNMHDDPTTSDAPTAGKEGDAKSIMA